MAFRKRTDPVIIPDNFCTDEFLSAWEEYVKVRKQMKAKKGVKDNDFSIGQALDKVVEYSQGNHDLAVKLVLQSYNGPWIGIFPLKEIDGVKKTSTSYVMQKAQSKQQPQPQAPMTTQQEQDMQKEFYDQLIKVVSIKNKLPLTWAYEQAFYHMKRAGIINDTMEEMKKFVVTVKAELTAEANELRTAKSASLPTWEKILQDAEITDKDKPNLFRHECRKRRVIAYLRQQYNIQPTA